MSYYGQFIQRQAEFTQATMAQARKALLEEAESEEAYRKSLMDRQKDLVKLQAGITKKLASAGKMTDSDWKWYFTQKKSLETSRSSRQLRTQSELQKIADKARFDRAKIAGLADEVARSAATGSVGKMIDMIKGDQVAGIVRGSAERAKQSGTAAQHDYALALETFMRQQFSDSNKELSPKEVGQLRQAAAEIAGVDARMVNEASVQQMVEADKKKFNSLISKPEAELLAELERWKDSPGNEEQTRLIKAALATKMAEGGVEAAEIESQLEALGRPMEVTEEAVRARTGELMEPYEGMTPFPIAAALGERFKEGRKRRMQERRGEKAMADFDDFSEDEKIIFQNAIKAEQWREDLGGILPTEDEMGSIEWRRAAEIMAKIEDGTLDKRAMIRTALQFAEKDLGRGAPPTDVRRQRDEIIERVMMLQANRTAYGKSSVKPTPPKPPPEPVVPPVAAAVSVDAAAPAGTGGGAGIPTTPAGTGGGADLIDPLSDSYLLSPAALAGSGALMGESGAIPLVPGGGSAVADVLDPHPDALLSQEERTRQQDARLREIDEQAIRSGEQNARLKQIEREARGAVIGDGTPTQSTFRVLGGSPREEDIRYSDPGNIETPAAVVFSQSRSMAEIPGSPRLHAALAQEAMDLGLPIPGWYRGLRL